MAIKQLVLSFVDAQPADQILKVRLDTKLMKPVIVCAIGYKYFFWPCFR